MDNKNLAAGGGLSRQDAAALKLAGQYLRPPIKLQLLKKGDYNSTYLGNDKDQKLIVRIAEKFLYGQSNLPPYQRAADAVVAAGAAGVPVGETLVTGDKAVPFVYQIYKFVEGISGDFYNGPQLDLWEQLGTIAQRINRVKTTGYGDEPFDTPTKPWPDYISEKISGLLAFQRNPKNEHLEQKVVFTTAELNIAGRLMEPLPYIKPDMRLVHLDLAPRNVIVNEFGKIVGVIDWDHAKSFPAEHQVALSTFWNNYPDPKAQQRKRAFLTGYGVELDESLIKAFMVYEYLTQLPYKNQSFAKMAYDILRGIIHAKS